jgi:ABC-type microcin C transport system permease subunit YejB
MQLEYEYLWHVFLPVTELFAEVFAKTMTKKSLMKTKEIGLAQNSKWYNLLLLTLFIANP